MKRAEQAAFVSVLKGMATRLDNLRAKTETSDAGSHVRECGRELTRARDAVGRAINRLTETQPIPSEST